ncbi:MAG: flagellar basal body P-ring protein FlgI [Smithellaceae bacterium]|nr:flagellar basal body P-ring protein FlgI [Smithellaceae bacterium]
MRHPGNKARFARTTLLIYIIIGAIYLFPSLSDGARLKDVASIGGVRENQLIGYGLLVGLAGTGDDIKNGFTRESLANMLTRQGLAMKDKNIKSANAAAVMITATLPPFSKIGSKIDVMVSSIGDSKSLHGGTLLMSPLRGADGEIYAVAQGAVTIGGFSAGGAGAGVTKNHTSVARIVNGATVERELIHAFEQNRTLTINLYQPDFSNAIRTGVIVNKEINNVVATTVDSSTIVVTMKEGFQGNAVNLVSLIESLEVPVDAPAVVVLNEKTGTVVMGENVRISTVAIAHGNLSIQIKEDTRVSQPLPFAPRPQNGQPVTGPGGVIVAPGGQTVVSKDTTVTVDEAKAQLMLLQKGVTIQEVVRALNSIGVTPRDLITILQTIKAAGAMQADLKII